MLKKFAYLTFFLAVPAIALTQTKMLTIEDATHMNPKLNASVLSQLQWRFASDNFVYVANNALVQGGPLKNNRDTLVRLADMNQLLKFNKMDTLKRFPSITYLSEDRFRFINGNKVYVCDIMKNSITAENYWDEKAENLDIAQVSLKAAFTRGNNLFLTVGGKETTVTSESDPGIVCGASRVHRNEFGISKGTFWSPGEEKIAFYRMDERMVTEYPLVDISTRIATEKPVRYPMAGMTSHTVKVGVYDLASGSTIFLETGRNGDAALDCEVEYLSNVTWSPDGLLIYIATLNRDQNCMMLNAYDAVTGKFSRSLFTERLDTYVEPLAGPQFLPGDASQFIWESRRDGYNHLYLYTTEGKLIRQLTEGPWEVTEFLGFDKPGTHAWFMCNKDNPLDRQAAKVDLKKFTFTQVTDIPATHNIKISGSGKFLLDTYSSTAIARQSEVLDANGRSLKVLLASDNPLKDYKLGEMTILTLKNAEGTDLYGRLIKPADFDPAKKYPVIIYVYGGPHSQLVTNTWLGGAGLFLNYLASQGFVVFTLDNRGTAARGRAFEQAIFRNLGTMELEDQMTGVRYLKSLPFVDTTRIGINGWSYGGFMTITMMLRNPGVFKVGVCGGPVVDWKYYEVMYGERYMDTPESNPKGYEESCLLNRVKDLTGRLLIIHDDQDETVVPQNSLVFLKKCVDEGKQVDFFVYPGHEHNVRGKDRIHLNRKMTDYFLQNL